MNHKPDYELPAWGCGVKVPTFNMYKILNNIVGTAKQSNIARSVKRYIAEEVNIPSRGDDIINTDKINKYLLSIAKYPKDISVMEVVWNYKNGKVLPFFEYTISDNNISFLCKDGYTICNIKYTMRIPTESLNGAFVDNWVLNNSNRTIEFIGRYRKKYKSELIKIFKDGLRYARSQVSTGSKHKALSLTSKGGQFDSLITLRTFDSVVYKNKRYIQDTIYRFTKQEDLYKKFHIMYKLGILLYGDPGCGKSTIIKAIIDMLSNKLNYTLRIFYLNTADSDIVGLERNLGFIMGEINDYNIQILGIKPMSIVILEEIDALSSKDNNGNDNDAKINLMLQYLDGPYSKDNVIYIATTNKYDKLDPRLIRDGRFDCKVSVNEFTTEEEVQELCDIFDADRSRLGDITFPIAPCTIQRMIFESYKEQ